MAAQRLSTNAGMRDAAELYRRALQRDPDYRDARASLSSALITAAYTGVLPRDETYREGRLEAERVLASDSANSVALATLGRIADWHDWNWPAARSYYEKALAGNPSNALAHANYGWLLMRLGEPERALAEARRAVELDPLGAGASNNLGALYTYVGQYRVAVTQYRNSLALAPDATLMMANLAYALTFAGDSESALQTLERARSLEPRDGYVLSTLAYVFGRAGRRAEAEKTLAELRALPTVQKTELAAALMGLGRTDEVLEQLEKGVAVREDYVVDLGMDPVYAPIRGEPRFQRLLARIGLR
jgi:serine/threonine-protein kinase